MADDGHEAEPFTVARLDHIPSYQQFLDDFLLANKPCILPPELIHDWCAREWAQATTSTSNVESTAASSSSNLHPAFDLLKNRYGDHVVPVVTTTFGHSPDGRDDGREGEEIETTREDMLLSEAIEKMHEACRLRSQGKVAPLIYIKDWHLVQQEQSRRRDPPSSVHSPTTTTATFKKLQPSPYITPDIFRDDWMNNDSFLFHPSPSSRQAQSKSQAQSQDPPDDFRFCYAGLKGTTTQLHRDVYTSYSWSTNLVGRKKWTLYAPHLSPLLRRSLEVGRGLTPLSPLERSTLDESSGKTVVVQEQGETIFIPSDVYHSVENLEDTISLNHNWCNAVNLPRMYESMREEMEEVEGALGDVKEMLRQAQRDRAREACRTVDESDHKSPSSGDDVPWEVEYWRLIQQVSRSDAGWDWLQFWQMIHRWLDVSTRACPSHLHPDLETFVCPRIEEILLDFRQRQEWPWLDEAVRDCVEKCSGLVGCSWRSD